MSKLLNAKEATFMADCMDGYTGLFDFMIILDVPRHEIWTFEKELDFVKKNTKRIRERKHLDKILLPDDMEAYLPELHRLMKAAEESKLSGLMRWS